MRYGKTYYQNVAAISDAKKSNPEHPTVWVLSERMRKRKGYDVGVVCWAKKEGKWRAYFQQNHIWEHLGFYDTKEDAKQAYLNRLNQQNIRNIYAK